MFGKNRQKSPKILIFGCIGVGFLIVALLLPGNRLLMSSIVNAGNTVEQKNTDTAERGTPFEAYTQQVQKIQDTARTLQSELTSLYAQKESLENRRKLKQNLLDAIKKQEEALDIKGGEKNQKKLQDDIDELSLELQNVESKITTIYEKITTYSQEVADIADIHE